MINACAVPKSFLPALICFTMCVSPFARLWAQTETALLKTCAGTIVSVDEKNILIEREGNSEGPTAFLIDDRLTPVYRGIRSLGIGELKRGMRVEIDHRPAKGDAPPVIMWIEVIPEKPEISFRPFVKN